MTTSKQSLGDRGERFVCRQCACPACKRSKTLKRLPTNFKCADLVCDFCGYLAQVKTRSTKTPETLPKTILGAAWGPQKRRMEAGIYFPLFLVQFSTPRHKAVFYLPADLQRPAMFKPRKPLSSRAKRAGWQGFVYDLSEVTGIVRLL